MIAVVLITLVPLYAVHAAVGKIYASGSVPKHDVAIVFGAGVWPNGAPTPYLESRLLAAINLYKTGKIKVLLMSGDNSTAHYNEPAAMKRYVVARGVPASSVVLDYAGYDTYDTCYRAHNLFGVTSAILVTHGYHLPRALWTCNSLGIRSVGVSADRPDSDYPKTMYMLREVVSLNKAALQLLLKPQPTVLGPKEDGVTAALSQHTI